MQVYEVGFNQLRHWLATGRISDPCAGIPELVHVLNIGDHVAIGSAQLKHLYIRAQNHEITQEIKDGGFEIWEIVDDYDSLFGYVKCFNCGNWVLPSCATVEEGEDYEVNVCWNCEGHPLIADFTDEYIEALAEMNDPYVQARRAFRDAWNDPIRYDVMMFVVATGKWLCVGANLGFCEAHDLVRKFERGGRVAYLCESQAVRNG